MDEQHITAQSRDLETPSTTPSPRRPYGSPNLTVYGDIQDITRTSTAMAKLNDGAVDDMGMALKTNF